MVERMSLSSGYESRDGGKLLEGGFEGVWGYVDGFCEWWTARLKVGCEGCFFANSCFSGWGGWAVSC